MVLDPEVDRMSRSSSSVFDLKAWAEAFNLTDVWRWRIPQVQAFTCHSATYKTFSRIDLVYSGGMVLSSIRHYHPP